MNIGACTLYLAAFPQITIYWTLDIKGDTAELFSIVESFNILEFSVMHHYTVLTQQVTLHKASSIL